MKRGSEPAVAIVGGGPAGAIASLVLARRGLRVAVIEAQTDSVGKAGETLPPSIAPLLERLGLGSALAADGQLRSRGNRSLWGSGEPAESPFIANPYGGGWHLDRQRFETRLKATAVQAGVRWLGGFRVVGCAPGPAGWRLDLASGTASRRVLNPAFVADATGRASRIARKLGTRRLRYDRLVGVHGVLASTTPDSDSTTLVEAVRDGWWYSANLPGGRLAVCFFSDGDLLELPLRRGDDRAWVSRLGRTEATRERVAVGGYRLVGPPRALPAESSRLDVIAGSGWLALGDAAAAYDPLSSYGITSAMGSGFYGGHSIADQLSGRREARDAYSSLMQRTYRTYLDLLATHYSRECRWLKAPFWRRRHSTDLVQIA